MPFVRIDTLKGHYNDSQREAIGEAIYQSLLEVGALPDDRFQIFSEKEPAQLLYGASYLNIQRTQGFVAVQITLNAGRSLDDKRRLYAGIAERMASSAGVRREDVFINLVEVPRENWSFGNGEAQYAKA
jgi:phenylpyruvate tautomerase PptA (4-oxalocrotonate tautomerase family)